MTLRDLSQLKISSEAIAEIKKSGMLVIPHKRWDTRKYFTMKYYTAFSYRHCPKRLNFQSPMVRHDNQHLCEGWTWFKDAKKETLDRVIHGKKPFGSLSFIPSSYSNGVDMAPHAMDVAVKAGCKVHRRERPWGIDGSYIVDVDVSYDRTLEDAFDLDALASDYERELPWFDIPDQIREYRTHNLTDFMPYQENHPPWLRGLILGYPVELTMGMLS